MGAEPPPFFMTYQYFLIVVSRLRKINYRGTGIRTHGHRCVRPTLYTADCRLVIKLPISFKYNVFKFIWSFCKNTKIAHSSKLFITFIKTAYPMLLNRYKKNLKQNCVKEFSRTNWFLTCVVLIISKTIAYKFSFMSFKTQRVLCFEINFVL